MTHTEEILWFGRKAILACDAKCSHAWGRRRPKRMLSNDCDDFESVSDYEAGPCPFSGMDLDSDGGDMKPNSPEGKNKWCARSCERSVIVGLDDPIVLPDWSVSRFNYVWRQEGK